MVSQPISRKKLEKQSPDLFTKSVPVAIFADLLFNRKVFLVDNQDDGNPLELSPFKLAIKDRAAVVGGIVKAEGSGVMLPAFYTEQRIVFV